jgi:serine/threonine protein kinase
MNAPAATTGARSLEARRARYSDISNRLAHIDRNGMSALLGEMGPAQGWGRTHTVKVGASKVFVKRIPVTDLEYENLFSTENLYHLPTFYNYGVGSAGFGVFRELVAHIKTTNWVLDGSIANFPLMYHYRIVPFAGTRKELDPERHERHIRYWNGDANIDRYIRARNAAPYEILIFLEHFPYVLEGWLGKNQHRIAPLIREIRGAIAFLRERGVLHFDSHLQNILVDEEGMPYLTDFGLVLDKGFTLDPAQKAFFGKHLDYDDAEFLVCIASYLFSLYWHLKPAAKSKLMRRYGFSEETGYYEVVPILLDNVETLQAERLLKLDDNYVAEVIRYRNLSRLMHEFFSRLQKSNQKDAPYPRLKIRQMLQEIDAAG